MADFEQNQNQEQEEHDRSEHNASTDDAAGLLRYYTSKADIQSPELDASTNAVKQELAQLNVKHNQLKQKYQVLKHAVVDQKNLTAAAEANAVNVSSQFALFKQKNRALRRLNYHLQEKLKELLEQLNASCNSNADAGGAGTATANGVKPGEIKSVSEWSYLSSLSSLDLDSALGFDEDNDVETLIGQADAIARLVVRVEELEFANQLINRDRSLLHRTIAELRQKSKPPQQDRNAKAQPIAASSSVPRPFPSPSNSPSLSTPSPSQSYSAVVDSESPFVFDPIIHSRCGDVKATVVDSSAQQQQSPQQQSPQQQQPPQQQQQQSTASAAASSESTCLSVSMSSDGSGVDEVFENQRYLPLWGWVAPPFKTDRHQFSDAAGRVNRLLENVNPPPGTKWTSNWKIDLNYAAFPQQYKSPSQQPASSQSPTPSQAQSGTEVASSSSSSSSVSSEPSSQSNENKEVVLPTHSNVLIPKETDAEGWAYSKDFPDLFPWHAGFFMLDCVRRRRWIRAFAPLTASTSSTSSSENNSNNNNSNVVETSNDNNTATDHTTTQNNGEAAASSNDSSTSTS